MNLQRYSVGPTRGMVLISFGTAQLVRGANGRLEVRGGTREELSDLKEWISFFMHEAVPRWDGR